MQQIKNYAWKLIGLTKGINIDDAVQELERIESLYGSLTPDNVLNASRPSNAVLHSLFEWDDSIAAERHRLQQARTILNNIEVTIISNGQPKQIAVYEVLKSPSGSQYKSIQTFSPNDIDYIKKRTKNELMILKNKLATYKELSNTVSLLTAAIDSMN